MIIGILRPPEDSRCAILGPGDGLEFHLNEAVADGAIALDGEGKRRPSGLLENVRLAWRRGLGFDGPFWLSLAGHRQSPTFGRSSGSSVVEIQGLGHGVPSH